MHRHTIKLKFGGAQRARAAASAVKDFFSRTPSTAPSSAATSVDPGSPPLSNDNEESINNAVQQPPKSSLISNRIAAARSSLFGRKQPDQGPLVGNHSFVLTGRPVNSITEKKKNNPINPSKTQKSLKDKLSSLIFTPKPRDENLIKQIKITAETCKALIVEINQTKNRESLRTLAKYLIILATLMNK